MNEELKSIRVSIFGREYNVKGGSDEEYIKGLAAYVDSVMRDIADRTGVLSSSRIAILAALNIADEMHKEVERSREHADRLARKLEEALGTESEKSEMDADA